MVKNKPNQHVIKAFRRLDHVCVVPVMSKYMYTHALRGLPGIYVGIIYTQLVMPVIIMTVWQLIQYHLQISIIVMNNFNPERKSSRPLGLHV